LRRLLYRLNRFHRFCHTGIWGSGVDDVGAFLIKGDFGENGIVRFAKKYYGAHVVLYTGTCEIDGIFGFKCSGKWEIVDNCEGTFEISKVMHFPEGPPADAEGWGNLEELQVKWTGHFVNNGERNEMVFNSMTVGTDGAIVGAGSDEVGVFDINGT